MRKLTVLLVLVIAVGLGCGKKSSSAPPVVGGLRAESELTDNLCNWPQEEFSPTNKVSSQLALAVGEYAIDFTLKDTSGTSYNLGELLATRPVLLILGSCT